MEETIAITEEVKKKEPIIFLPSAFQQAQESISNYTSELATTESKQEIVEEIKFEKEDVGDAIGTPFDLAGIVTRHKGWYLSPEEKERLSRVWLKPFQRHFGTVKGMDIYMALCATVTIVTDKTLDYLEKKELEKRGIKNAS